jgi:sodium-dependent phosphate cotransporter
MPLGPLKSRLPVVGRVLLFLGLLFIFLVAIELLAGSMEVAGSDTATSMLQGLNNPFAGLAAGILATVLVQSSSVTTSTIVALVGAGQLSVTNAIPIVMGANIGTSVTSTLVSLGHVTRSDEFRRAFAGATVHDFFNLLAVAVFLPLELATGYMEHTATWLVSLGITGTDTGFNNPATAAVKATAAGIQHGLASLGLAGGWLAILMLLVALFQIMGALYFITKLMKSLLADRIEEWLNRVLEQKGMIGLVIGMATTMAVQSSSITTSLLIPMFAAGVLSLEAGFPLVVGANIGTTITAILAATVTNQAGMTIAFVHFLFNASGAALFLPIPPLRRLPLNCARWLADAATKNRMWVLIYLGTVFVAIPLLGIFIWK